MTATVHHPPKIRRSFLQQPDFVRDGIRLPCRDVDPDLFFPVGDDLFSDEARAVCRRCPVKDECGQWATERGIPYGMWGGLTPGQRAKRRQRVVAG